MLIELKSRARAKKRVFKEAFINLTNAIKEAYSTQIEASEELTELFSDPDNYIKINFAYVFSLLEDLQGSKWILNMYQ